MTNCSPGASRRRARAARALSDLRVVRAALWAGEVGVDQVDEVARLHANPRCGGQVVGSESILLQAAQQLEFAELRVVTQRWLTLADPDGAHRDHAAADAGRDFRIREHGAGFTIEANCGVLQGTAIREMWQRFQVAEFRTDWEAARNLHGARSRPVSCHALRRSAASTDSSRWPKPVPPPSVRRPWPIRW